MNAFIGGVYCFKFPVEVCCFICLVSLVAGLGMVVVRL